MVTQRRLLPSTGMLAAFESVARLGSFSAAAAELSLTQSAVSRQVAQLEDQLGVRLFERGGRGVFLTPEGKSYSETVAAALKMLRMASLNLMSKRHGGSLNLAILPTFGTRWLMPRIPGFVARHPEIILNFATRIGRFDFDKEGIDVGIHIGQPDWPQAVSTFLMNEFVVPVCSAAFRAQHPQMTAHDLASLPLFHMNSRPGAWEHWFESIGEPAPAAQGMWFEQFSTVTQACIAGLGVALMPEFLIRTELETGQLVIAVPHRVKSPSAYYVVAPAARAQKPAVAAFIEWITGQARDHMRATEGEASAQQPLSAIHP